MIQTDRWGQSKILRNFAAGKIGDDFTLTPAFLAAGKIGGDFTLTPDFLLVMPGLTRHPVEYRVARRATLCLLDSGLRRNDGCDFRGQTLSLSPSVTRKCIYNANN